MAEAYNKMRGGKREGEEEREDRLGSASQIDHANLFLPRTTHDVRRKFSVSVRGNALYPWIGVVAANALISKTFKRPVRAAGG